jgi:hypothetical protein
MGSGVDRLDIETIAYRCPSCSHTITSGPPVPPPPDPLAADRSLLGKLYAAPSHVDVDRAANDLAASFDGEVVDIWA